MRAFSRNMAKLPAQQNCWLALVATGGVLASPGLAWWPLAFALPLLSICMTLVHEYRRRRIVTERSGETICHFARSFDCRSTDPWIVRAVYEELSATCRHPIRRTDRFDDDLHIVDEDIDFIAMDVAKRAGRSLARTEVNPMYGKVKTVADLVVALQFQPTTQADIS